MATPSRADPSSPTPEPGIECFTLGPFATNCYVVTPGNSSESEGPHPKSAGKPCWIVDASFEPDSMIEYVREHGLTPQALILTHTHVDHIAGVRDVLEAFPGTPLLVHPLEREWLSDPVMNLSGLFGMPVTTPEPTGLLNSRDAITLGGAPWEVRHTPGHSPGGVTLYEPGSGIAIVGDTLFSRGIGRTDFAGGDLSILERSIREQLYTLPERTRVFPGHGPPTTIARERKSNPFVSG